MSNFITGKVLRELQKGIKVEKASATLPATTTQNIFTVTGGRVAIRQLVGEVTTIFDAEATNLKITAAPTVGTAVDIASNVAIANKEAGTLLGTDGAGGATLAANAGALFGQTRDVIVNTGAIRIETSATNTGATKWTLLYVPIDDGASVASA